MLTLTTTDIARQNTRFLKALRTAKMLEDDLKDFYAHIEEQMVEHDITSIKGDWGHLTLATRKNWQGDKLPPRFYKQVLDTTKLNLLHKAGERLPSGASFTESRYLSKRIK
jgi:hypothetical protein